MGEKMLRLGPAGADERKKLVVGKRRRLAEGLERHEPRLHEAQPLLDGAPRRAGHIVVFLGWGSARLRKPVGKLLRKCPGVFLVACFDIGADEALPKIHPVQLPCPFGVPRSLFRCRVEEPVDAAGRERPRDAHDRDFPGCDPVRLSAVEGEQVELFARAERLPVQYCGSLAVVRGRFEFPGDVFFSGRNCHGAARGGG